MNDSRSNSGPSGPTPQGERPAATKPAVPLEEMVDRARAARGEADGEETLSSAAKAPSPTPDAPPGPPGDETATTADLLDAGMPEGANPSKTSEDDADRPQQQ